MLLLTRQIGESLYIGEQIKVTVVKQGKRHLQLGIEAPPDVRILREELRGTPDLKGQLDAKKTRFLGKIEL